MAGSVTALLLASSLVARFSGRGLVPDALTGDVAFLTAVGGGAAATGACGHGNRPSDLDDARAHGRAGGGRVFAANGQLRLSALGTGFVAPLLLSPIAATLLMAGLYASVRLVRSRWRTPQDICVCVANTQPTVNLAATYANGGADAATFVAAVPIIAPVSECTAHGLTPSATASAFLNGAHYLSAGAVGFARGVKIRRSSWRCSCRRRCCCRRASPFWCSPVSWRWVVSWQRAVRRDDESPRDGHDTGSGISCERDDGCPCALPPPALVTGFNDTRVNGHIIRTGSGDWKCPMANHHPDRSGVGRDVAVRCGVRRIAVVVDPIETSRRTIGTLLQTANGRP